jgi:pSer/pThr/pTyr-binding forkhead associated (FHA) protein
VSATPGPHRSTPAELQARLQAERGGTPFLVYFDAAERQVIHELLPAAGAVTIGRSADCGVGLAWDREVSRLHAQLEAVGPQWVLVDDGLSRNGSFVNGERVVGRRVLRDGDRLCFGETPVIYRASPGTGGSSTIGVMTGPATVSLTPTQRGILVALCRPVRDSAFATPPTNREIAEEVHLSVDAVKAHLRTLFERFELEALPQNQKRARLAAIALLQGIVTAID